jgi:phosphonate transport system permease protein
MQTTPAMTILPGVSRSTLMLLASLALLFLASFATVNIEWSALMSPEAAHHTSEFLSGFFPPETATGFLRKLAFAAGETMAMSTLGTALAAIFGVLIALPAARAPNTAMAATMRAGARLVLNVSRAVPELVWASILVISAGLGPLAGTLALAFHTTGVLGRLFADAFENLPPEPAAALRTSGASRSASFLYATLPQALPQLVSYTLYRWENNIRAAAVLGVVGAGGLGQMLMFHMSLFQMNRTGSIVIVMLILVALVDALSTWARHHLAGAARTA